MSGLYAYIITFILLQVVTPPLAAQTVSSCARRSSIRNDRINIIRILHNNNNNNDMHEL